MKQTLCGECLKTYKPYTYSETIQRALVSGTAEWQGVDDECNILRRYREYCKERRFYNHGNPNLNEHGHTSNRDEIRNLFPSVDDFMVCHGNFNKERATKISASFLCFDCEKHLCAKCIAGHSGHFTFSEDDKKNMKKWNEIESKMMQKFEEEGDEKEENIKQERAVLRDVKDVKDSVSVAEWEKFVSSELENDYELGIELDRDYVVWDMCILNDSLTFLVISYNSTHMKIYSTSSYEQIDSIELPYIPAGITEIPSTDPSKTLIAVSFPGKRQINLMNLNTRPTYPISSINVPDKCFHLAYCNNKLITRCWDYLDGEWCDSIHVMDMSGEIINIIDLHKLTELQPKRPYIYPMSLNSENETIYVCHNYCSVVCLSFTGQVLHSTMFASLNPRNICIDRDQNVYVMDETFPLYRLSSDLSERVKIVDEDESHVGEVTFIKHHKNKMYMANMKGFVYILNVD